MSNQDKKDEKPYIFLGTTRAAHESNKREAFDGMRAYHMSEINHKKDAIDILKTLLTLVVAVFTGLVATSYNEIIDTKSANLLGWIISFINAGSVFAVVYTTNIKITKDNNRYSIYANEYAIERLMIGLEDELKKYGYVSKWTKPVEPKSGFHYTKNILIAFGITICSIGFCGAYFVQEAQGKNNLRKNTTEPKSMHVIIDSPFICNSCK